MLRFKFKVHWSSSLRMKILNNQKEKKSASVKLHYKTIS